MAKQIVKASASKAPPTPASKAPPPKASAAPPPAKGTPADAGASINAPPAAGKAPPKGPPAPPARQAATAPTPPPAQGSAAAPAADKPGRDLLTLISKMGEQIKALSQDVANLKGNGVRPDAIDVSGLLSEEAPAYLFVQGQDENDPRLTWHGRRVRTVYFDTHYDKKSGWHTVRSPGRQNVGILAIPDDNDPGGKGTMGRNNGQLAFYYNWKADGTHEGAPLYVYPDELTGENHPEGALVLQWHDGEAWQDYG